jgi:hypothetical protein
MGINVSKVMTVTEYPSKIVVCHVLTGRGGRRRSGSRALCIRALCIGACEKRKAMFIHGKLAQHYQCVDYEIY